MKETNVPWIEPDFRWTTLRRLADRGGWSTSIPLHEPERIIFYDSKRDRIIYAYWDVIPSQNVINIYGRVLMGAVMCEQSTQKLIDQFEDDSRDQAWHGLCEWLNGDGSPAINVDRTSLTETDDANIYLIGDNSNL